MKALLPDSGHPWNNWLDPETSAKYWHKNSKCLHGLASYKIAKAGRMASTSVPVSGIVQMHLIGQIYVTPRILAARAHGKSVMSIVVIFYFFNFVLYDQWPATISKF